MDKVNIQFNDTALLEWKVYGPFKDGEVPINLNMNSGFESSFGDLIQVIIKVDFYYQEDPSKLLLTGKVVTNFRVSMKENETEIDKTDIPDQAFITMLSIAISHARALLVQQAKGVGLRGIIIPIVNPTEIYQGLKSQLDSGSN